MKNFSKNTVYALKRAYGVKAVLYRIIDKSLNLESGLQTLTLLSNNINRAVFLPTDVIRTVLSEGVHYFDPDKRLVIIDVNFTINIGDYLISKQCKYTVIEVNNYELESGQILIVQSDDRGKYLLADDTLTLTQATA